jgi:ribosome-associated toxin RatA of RatAB toxin-antitoxin module
MAKLKTEIYFVNLVVFVLAVGFLMAPAFSSPDTVAVAEGDNKVQKENAAVNTKNGSHIVATTLDKVFKADDSAIWRVLTDFKKYPNIFKRIKSVEITKNDGGLVYTESHLQPGPFVQHPIQHMVSDLTAGPKILNWHMLDGNFKYLKGRWEITQRSDKTCNVRYTLYVDVGPIIPACMVNFIVHHIQQEIVTDLKNYVESEYKKKDQNNSLSCVVNTPSNT